MSEEIKIPDANTVPYTSEGMEAYQNTLNKFKEKAVSEMTETEQLKMRTIEKVVSILEKEEIEFYLFANPREEGKRQFWQFNKLEYSTEDEVSFAEKGRRIIEKVWGHNGVYWAFLEHIFKTIKINYAYLLDKDGKDKFFLDLYQQKILEKND